LLQVRAIDAFNPNDLAIPIMIKGGITTAQVLPGSANIMVSLSHIKLGSQLNSLHRAVKASL